MDFRFPAILMAILSTNFVIIMIYVIMRNEKVLFRFGFQILHIFLILTGLRILLPFEFTAVSHNVYLPESVSRYVTAYMHEGFFNETVSWWDISTLVWLTGSIICLGKYLKTRHRFEQFLEKYGETPPETSGYVKELQKIKSKDQKNNSVQLLLLPGITVPMVYGIRRPRILIPKDLPISEEELPFILKHEMTHFIHHDLCMKLGIQLLCIVYWWNPITILLKRQMDAVLEMHVDSKITDSTEDKIVYTQCLLNIARKSVCIHTPDIAIAFCGKNANLKNRCYMLLNNDRTTQHTSFKNLLLLSVILMYILSFTFILEPNYADPETLKGCTMPTLENSYVTENEDGTFNFYLNGEFICVTPSRRYYFDGTSIYRYDEEAIVHEK